jgi:glycosyltransferase involved in cell wall biosynthesis
MIVTIFTPSYNRAYTLPRLYQSLLRQTSKEFCWLIVDDGSVDNTEDLVKSWIDEGRIEIHYHKQKNQGKPMAHNKGVELTVTELFTCVDSDDYLTDDAVEEIIKTWKKPHLGCIGILGYREREREGCLTKLANPNIKQGTLRYLYDHGLSGDTILIYETDVLKKYKFPQYIGEKFIPEAYLYDLLDQHGELMLLRKSIYVCEYLEDGYTANMSLLLYKNPNGYFCYINQRLKLDTDIRQKLADSIRYVAMSVAHHRKKIIDNAVYPLYAFIVYPAGWLLYFIRYKKLNGGKTIK